MAALLGAGLLVLDVVARHPDLDESTDEFPNVGIATVPGIGVRDDEGAEVHLRRRPPLLVVHLRSGEMLVLVGSEKRSNKSGRLVRDLTEGVAGKIRTWVLGLGPLRRGGPTAQVDPFESQSLHGHCLAR